MGVVDKEIPGASDLVTTGALTTVKVKYLPLMIKKKNAVNRYINLTDYNKIYKIYTWRKDKKNKDSQWI